jgi:hypothetical protein
MRLHGSTSSEATDATACRPIGDVSVAELSHGMINNGEVVTALKGAAIRHIRMRSAEVTVVDEPLHGVGAEAGLVDDAGVVEVGVGGVASTVLPAGPEHDRALLRDGAVPALAGQEVGHGEGVVRVAGCLGPNVNLDRGQEQIVVVEVVGEQAAFFEVSGGAPVGSGVLAFLHVLQVETVGGDGEGGGAGEGGVPETAAC